MLYGDLVTLLPDGIHLPPKALLPIGIFPESCCWGVWIDDASPDDVQRLPHLVVSPLHPRVWPFLLRIELKLKDTPGAMAGAAAVLARHHMNIQFGESAPSGHHHATWNVVCEAADIRSELGRELDRLRSEMTRGPDRTLINPFANTLAAEMYRRAQDLERDLTASGHLHPRFGQQPDKESFLLHNPDELSAEIATTAQNDYPRNCRIRWIQNLTVFALYGTRTNAPFRFDYNSSQSILRPRDGFADILARGRIRNSPLRAIASLYPEENHVRIMPLVASTGERFHTTWLEYEARFHDNGHRTPPAPHFNTTWGVWKHICDVARMEGINLLRVTNKTTQRDEHLERGTITLHGVGTETNRTRFDGRMRDVPQEGRDLTIEPLTRNLDLAKVFISRRMTDESAADLLETAIAKAREAGLEPVYLDEGDSGKELTATVIEKIRSCQAFFQIMTLSEEEGEKLKRDRHETGRPSWLLFELGIALGYNLACQRVVDISQLPDERLTEILTVHADQLVPRFRKGVRASREECFGRTMRLLADGVSTH